MILIADSGSTKTDWYGRDTATGEEFRLHTVGLNPSLQGEETFEAALRRELCPALPPAAVVRRVYFYGAGCTEARIPAVERSLGRLFGEARIEAASDLLGAARALCGDAEGIACILGTGSNSCLYDGQRIVCHTPSLGYILGDEGSGAVLGRNLIGELLKGTPSEALRRAFAEETGLSTAEIIEKVYRGSAPNRFLAGLSPFIARHRTELRDFLITNFRAFFRRNVCAYPGADRLPVHFTGSIAYHYEEEVRTAAKAEGLSVGVIEKNPIDKLAAFHLAERR